jgi:hypothetical protein
VNRIIRNLTTIYRIERLIARRRFAIVQNQAILIVLAGVVALIGLIFLNWSLFLALELRMSPVAASAILAVVNIALAGLLVSRAGRMNVEDEIAPAVEVRDLAIADLEAEVEDAVKEARNIVNSLKGLHKDPFGSLTTFILPLVAAMLKKS